MPEVSAVSIEAQFAAARAAWQRNDVVRAETLLRGINARDTRHEDAALLLAEVLRSQGRLSAASQVVLELCRAKGFEAELSLRGARFAQQCDRHPIAAQICAEALARGTPPPALRVMAGHIARESGDFETARAHYLAALDAGADLEHSHVLGALANTKRYTDPSDPDVARLTRHFHDAAFSPRSRAAAGFGLAKVQNDLGDYAEAARTLREANAMVRGVQPWDRSTWRAFVAARMAERAAPAWSAAAPDFVPVFIVGLPRSGTTLTATLLSRSSPARDRGELRALRFIGEQLIGGAHLGNASALTEAMRLYRVLAVQDDAPATWYIDQDPLNFRWLHVAAAMFPQARVIHLRRDRRDTALSLWSQDFAHPDMAFAYGFDDIADYAQGHDALMRHWRQTLRIPIHELDYEALVAEPERTLAALRDFIGVPAIDADARDESAPVQSASVWQARQPIYKTSVGRWRHYAAYVPELERFG